MDLKNIDKKNKISNHLILKFFFVVSHTAMTIILSYHSSLKRLLFSALFSAIIAILLVFRYRFLDIIKSIKKEQMIISIIFTIFTIYKYSYKIYLSSIRLLSKINWLFRIPLLTNKSLTIALGSLSFFVVFLYFYAFINLLINSLIRIKDDMDYIDKGFFIFFAILFSVLVIILFNKINAFYLPKTESGQIIYYDVIYTSDSGSHFVTNVYFDLNAVENDIRQPLFALFAMPFFICATILSKVLYFVPNSFAIFLTIIQVLILTLTIILIVKLTYNKLTSKIFLYFIMFFSYPTLLFAFTLEQYIFSLFWLILLIYSFIFERPYKEFYYVAASGSLLTSAITLLLFIKKNIKTTIKTMFFLVMKFISFIIVFGRFSLLLGVFSYIKHMVLIFGGKGLSFSNKFFQFTNFISSCFIAPSAKVCNMCYNHISYQLHSVKGPNILGMFILIIILIGAILIKKTKIFKIMFLWILYSFIILVLVGWGTRENGLILYTLYFSWAYIPIVFMLIDSFLDKFGLKKIKNVFWICIIFCVFIFNFNGMYSLISFAITYYPIS